ncbi:hypothetical protein BRC94_03190 [Halobacteriales archaeon QS_5_70_17]|nr:MAG: hypothetical protein BRC94_03190 [Halobacteriales archaeon QS_5_70_17]
MNMVDDESERRELGQCTECGAIFAVEVTNEGEAVPIGTDGTCSCGNPVFDVIESEDVDTGADPSGSATTDPSGRRG